MFTVGFFLTFGGVGTIEQSVTDAALYDGILVAVIGLMIMACGSLGMRQLDSK
jgi:hypothetical protein